MTFFPNIFQVILGDFPKQKLDPLFDEKNQTAYFLDNAGNIHFKKGVCSFHDSKLIFVAFFFYKNF